MKIRLIASIVLLWSVLAKLALLAQPTVEVLRPNSEDRLQPGTTLRVQWRTQGLGTANIDWSIILYTNNVGLRFVTPLPAAILYDGNGNWHANVALPSDLPSSRDYTLKVNDDVSEANDHSDVFCLGAPLVTIRVSQVEICWTSRLDRMYQVQYRSTFTTNLWTNLGAPVQGNGSTNCITDAVVPDQPQRYYRVEELQSETAR